MCGREDGRKGVLSVNGEGRAVHVAKALLGCNRRDIDTWYFVS